ncbi:MAG: hypothetical protein AAFP89_25025 [Bacteroidota bacterium]
MNYNTIKYGLSFIYVASIITAFSCQTPKTNYVLDLDEHSELITLTQDDVDEMHMELKVMLQDASDNIIAVEAMKDSIQKYADSLSLKIDSMMISENNRRQIIQKVLKKYKQFPTMSSTAQKNFLKDVFIFLDNEDAKTSGFAERAREIVNQAKMKSIDSVLAAQDALIKVKNDTINLLGDTILHLIDTIEKKDGLLDSQKQMIEEITDNLRVTQFNEERLSDTLQNLITRIDSIKKNSKEKELLERKLKEIIETRSPITVSSFEIRPVEVRSNKDGLYKAKKIKKGLQVKMKLRLDERKPSEENYVTLTYKLRILGENGITSLKSGQKKIGITANSEIVEIVGNGLRFAANEDSYVIIMYNNIPIFTKTLTFI